MNYFNSEVNIYIPNNGKINIYYSYNQNSTFQDLLEYLAYIFPELDICNCFIFRFRNDKNNNFYFNNDFEIDNQYKILKYSNYLKNLNLYKNKKYCSCKFKQYFKYSKSSIISFLGNSNDKLEKEVQNLQNEKTTDKSKISDLEKKNYYQNNEINILKKQKDNQSKNINNLEEKIEKISKDNKLLEIAVNGDIEKINLLNNLGVKGKNLKTKDNLIKIGQNSNIVIENDHYNKIKFINF